VDVRLDELVLRALETRPERRFQQASDVKTCVETIVAGRTAVVLADSQKVTMATPAMAREKQPWTSFWLATTYAGWLLIGFLSPLLLFGSFLDEDWLVGLFVAPACISAALLPALKRRAATGTERVCFNIASWSAFITALAMIGLTMLCLVQLFSQPGRWHVNPAEVVFFLFLLLGAVLLPLCGWRLRRAAIRTLGRPERRD
jgi:hypothetical protein